MQSDNASAEQVRSWIEVAGQSDPDLEKELDLAVQSRMERSEYSWHDVKYIQKMHLQVSSGALDVSDKTLEKLRRLCQLWDVDLRMKEITSHRRIIGPLIVTAKKLFYPVLKIFMKDFIRQQRAFNAAAIALMVDLANRSHDRDAEDSSDRV